MPDPMKTLTMASCAGLLLLAAGCALQPDPPPELPPSAYGGTGAEMAKCMQYASEAYCERQSWGGNNSRGGWNQ